MNLALSLQQKTHSRTHIQLGSKSKVIAPVWAGSRIHSQISALSGSYGSRSLSTAASKSAAEQHVSVPPLDSKTLFVDPSRPTRNSLDDQSLVGLTGGEIFHEMMLRHNVKVVFGYPGGAILPVYDAIYNSEYFDFVLPRHEQGAGHMAEGFVLLASRLWYASLTTQ